MVNFTSEIQHVVLLPSEQFVQTLTLSFSLLEALDQVDVAIKASNGVSSWVLSVHNEGSEEKPTYRVGPLSMGKEVLLSEGEWEMSLLNKDGRTLVHTFTVNVPAVRNEQRPVYHKEQRLLTSMFETQVILFDAKRDVLQTVESVTSLYIEENAAYALVRGNSKQVGYLITL